MDEDYSFSEDQIRYRKQLEIQKERKFLQTYEKILLRQYKIHVNPLKGETEQKYKNILSSLKKTKTRHKQKLSSKMISLYHLKQIAKETIGIGVNNDPLKSKENLKMMKLQKFVKKQNSPKIDQKQQPIEQNKFQKMTQSLKKYSKMQKMQNILKETSLADDELREYHQKPQKYELATFPYYINGKQDIMNKIDQKMKEVYDNNFKEEGMQEILKNKVLKLKKTIYLLKQKNNDLLNLKQKGNKFLEKYKDEAMCAKVDTNEMMVTRYNFKNFVEETNENQQFAYMNKKKQYVNFQSNKNDLIQRVAKLLDDIKNAKVKKDQLYQDNENIQDLQENTHFKKQYSKESLKIIQVFNRIMKDLILGKKHWEQLVRSSTKMFEINIEDNGEYEGKSMFLLDSDLNPKKLFFQQTLRRETRFNINEYFPTGDSSLRSITSKRQQRINTLKSENIFMMREIMKFFDVYKDFPIEKVIHMIKRKYQNEQGILKSQLQRASRMIYKINQKNHFYAFLQEKKLLKNKEGNKLELYDQIETEEQSAGKKQINSIFEKQFKLDHIKNRQLITGIQKNNNITNVIYFFSIEHLFKLFNMLQNIYKISRDPITEKFDRNVEKKAIHVSLIRNLIFTMKERKNFHIKYNLQKTLSFKNVTKITKKISNKHTVQKYQTTLKNIMSNLFKEYFPKDDFLMDYFGGSIMHNQVFALFFNKSFQFELMLQEVHHEIYTRNDKDSQCRIHKDQFYRHEVLIKLIKEKLDSLSERCLKDFSSKLEKIFTNWQNFHQEIAQQNEEVQIKIQHLRKTNQGLEWFEDHFEEFKQAAIIRLQKKRIEKNVLDQQLSLSGGVSRIAKIKKQVLEKAQVLQNQLIQEQEYFEEQRIYDVQIMSKPVKKIYTYEEKEEMFHEQLSKQKNKYFLMEQHHLQQFDNKFKALKQKQMKRVNSQQSKVQKKIEIVVPNSPSLFKGHYNFFDHRANNYSKLMKRYHDEYKKQKDTVILKRFLKKNEGRLGSQSTWKLEEFVDQSSLYFPATTTAQGSKSTMMMMRMSTQSQSRPGTCNTTRSNYRMSKKSQFSYISNIKYIPEFKMQKRLLKKTKQVRKLTKETDSLINNRNSMLAWRSQKLRNDQKINFTNSRLQQSLNKKRASSVKKYVKWPKPKRLSYLESIQKNINKKLNANKRYSSARNFRRRQLSERKKKKKMI